MKSDRQASYGGHPRHAEWLSTLKVRARNAFLPNSWLNAWGWAALAGLAGVLFLLFVVITRSFLFSVVSAPAAAWGAAWTTDYISGRRIRRMNR